MSEIVKRTSSVPAASSHILNDDEFERVWRMSKALAASGMFKDVTQAEQAFGRILLGRDLGLTPTQALMSVDVVRGNVQVRSVRLAAWVRQHDDYDYKVVEHDEQHCVIEFYFKGEIEGVSSFTIEDAKNAGLSSKDVWKAHPRNMLFARAMSNGVKWYCPEVTGGIPVYTEADEFIDSHAVEIGTGEGDGSEPGWEGLTPELVEEIEAVLSMAEAFGAPMDRAAVMMRLNGRPEAVAAWVADTNEVLAQRSEEQES